MKKKYSKPQMRCYQIRVRHQLLAGSAFQVSGVNDSFNYNSEEADGSDAY